MTTNTSGRPAVPDDIGRLLAALSANAARARNLASTLSPAAFSWRPAAGAWSIGECLDHLARANRAYLDRMRPAVEELRRRGVERTGPIAPGPFGRLFVRVLEPPVRMKVRAPRAIRPAPSLDPNLVLAGLLETHAEAERLLVEGAALDLNRAAFANPFVGFARMRVGTGFFVIAAHERRHIWQADRVREASGFPAE